MRSFISVAILSLFLAATVSSQVFFRANLTGAQSVPAVTTPATGTLYGVLDPASRLMYYRVTVARLQGFLRSGSFGIGAPGSAGTNVLSLTFFNNTAPGQWSNISDDNMIAMLKGNCYVTIASAANAGGEIRGQLEIVSAIEFAFDMEGSQETPAVAGGGRGTGYLILHSNGSADYRLTVSALTGPVTGAHFHVGAPGTPGPVVHTMTVSDSTISGTWNNIPDSLIVRLMKGQIYANVHTATNPNGEARGQVVRNYPATFRAYLNGAGESPTVSGAGRGVAWIVLGGNSAGLEYRGTYTDLSGAVTTSYLGIGARGTAGTSVHPTAFSGFTDDQAWNNLPDNAISALVRGNLFLNLATASHPNGEIRGQFETVEGSLSNQVTIEAGQEVPTVNSFANGTGIVMVNFPAKTVTHSERVAQLTGPVTGSHFHLGARGVSGPVVLSFTPVDTASSAVITNVADSTMLNMLRGKIYMNFHTAANPNGEARGQLLLRGYVSEVRQTSALIPQQYQLGQNYPNPFNPSTSFDFELNRADLVTVTLFNVLGQQVATLVNGMKTPGTYHVTYDASALPSGVYFYRMQTASGFAAVRKMMLMR